ncbi:hypothetical protein AK812_SmicGene16195, partial [Symbiodinium microadriaticum]
MGPAALRAGLIRSAPLHHVAWCRSFIDVFMAHKIVDRIQCFNQVIWIDSSLEYKADEWLAWLRERVSYQVAAGRRTYEEKLRQARESREAQARADARNAAWKGGTSMKGTGKGSSAPSSHPYRRAMAYTRQHMEVLVWSMDAPPFIYQMVKYHEIRLIHQQVTQAGHLHVEPDTFDRLLPNTPAGPLEIQLVVVQDASPCGHPALGPEMEEGSCNSDIKPLAREQRVEITRATVHVASIICVSWPPMRKQIPHSSHFVSWAIARCDPTFDCEFNDWADWSSLVAKKTPAEQVVKKRKQTWQDPSDGAKVIWPRSVDDLRLIGAIKGYRRLQPSIELVCTFYQPSLGFVLDDGGQIAEAFFSLFGEATFAFRARAVQAVTEDGGGCNHEQQVQANSSTWAFHTPHCYTQLFHVTGVNEEDQISTCLKVAAEDPSETYCKSEFLLFGKSLVLVARLSDITRSLWIPDPPRGSSKLLTCGDGPISDSAFSIRSLENFMQGCSDHLFVGGMLLVSGPFNNGEAAETLLVYDAALRAFADGRERIAWIVAARLTVLWELFVSCHDVVRFKAMGAQVGLSFVAQSETDGVDAVFMAIGGYSRTKETEKQKTENQRGSALHAAIGTPRQYSDNTCVDKSAIDVVYGFRLGRDYHMDAPIAPNERRQNKRTTAVWFLEADARSQTPLHQLFQAVNGPFPQRLIRWLGWYQWRKGRYSHWDLKANVPGERALLMPRPAATNKTEQGLLCLEGLIGPFFRMDPRLMTCMADEVVLLMQSDRILDFVENYGDFPGPRWDMILHGRLARVFLRGLTEMLLAQTGPCRCFNYTEDEKMYQMCCTEWATSVTPTKAACSVDDFDFEELPNEQTPASLDHEALDSY